MKVEERPVEVIHAIRKGEKKVLGKTRDIRKHWICTAGQLQSWS